MAAVINPLLENGLIEIGEKVTERYRPKKTTVVRITFERGDTERLHECFGMVSRSRQQEKLLIAYLDLSARLSPGGELKEVERDKLLSTAGTSPAVLRSLIDKGILETVKKSVNRFASAGTPDNAINLSPLSESQKRALDELDSGFRRLPIQLLHGVTGSGKTEIHTHLMARSLNNGDRCCFSCLKSR